MKTWHANLVVRTFNNGGNEIHTSFSFHRTELRAASVKEAKKLLLSWARKRLSRFQPRKKRNVVLFASPWLERRKACDGNDMLRNRFCRSTIPSLLRGSAHRILVHGYGPRAVKELGRKA